MLTCAELVRIVSDYIDGTLDDRVRESFDAHLAICPPCRAYLGQMRETKRQLGRLAEDELPEDMQQALLLHFNDWKVEP